jgi:hypothetical protein
MPMGSRAASSSVQELTSQTEDGLFDFRHTSSFAEKYLKTFYRDRAPTSDERVVFQFLAEHVHRIHDDPVLLEVGCGPTVHHILPFTPYVSRIHMADYLDENLEQVRQWRDNHPAAGNWSQYAELALGLDVAAARAQVADLEQSARCKLGELWRCDLRNRWVLGTPAQYQVVTAFYCTEEVGITTARWEEVMENLTRLVAPGGHLFLSCLRDTDFYMVDGTEYPCARISEADVRRVLPRFGFAAEESVVESVNVKGQEDQGVVGVVLAVARKAS